MILSVFLIVLSLLADGLIYYFAGLYQIWWLFFVPILLLPVLCVLLFGLLIVILFFCSLFIDKNKTRKAPNRFVLFIVNEVNHQLIFLSRTKIKRVNFDALPSDGVYIATYNHVSNFDPMILMDLFRKKPIVCISKKENLKIPIMGPFIQKAGFPAFDRSSLKEASQCVLTAVRDAKNLGYSILIAPEGTRSKEGKVLSFHPGAYEIARLAKKEVLEFALQGAENIHRNFPWKRTRVTVTYLGKIDLATLEAVPPKELASLSQKRYEEALNP